MISPSHTERVTAERRVVSVYRKEKEVVLCSDASSATTAAAATLPRKHPVAEQVAALLAVAGGTLHHIAGGKAPGAVHDLLLLLLLASGRLLMLLLSGAADAGLVPANLGVYFENAAVRLYLCLRIMLASKKTKKHRGMTLSEEQRNGKKHNAPSCR